MTADQKAAISTPEYRAAFDRYIRWEVLSPKDRDVLAGGRDDGTPMTRADLDALIIELEAETNAMGIPQ